ncbi:hypothetical protein M153_6050004892 [Pseudoloma neurophilia]|uniref:Uncharacterized protein n=1 Tax=Pseudoloma neurophilia TaxID=146866 RepID=A0A0R0LX39_9MICR|nr:hypothetical protein M153_6050004892 [Pseudoloma neurophilia]
MFIKLKNVSPLKMFNKTRKHCLLKIFACSFSVYLMIQSVECTEMQKLPILDKLLGELLPVMAVLGIPGKDFFIFVLLINLFNCLNNNI